MLSASDNAPAAGETTSPAAVKVWDIGVRAFHWSLVAAFAAAWITADEWERPHELLGYAAVGLVVFRFAWGFVGSSNARFASFVRGPRAVIAYLADIASGRERRYLGHNPAGAAMILALLSGVAGLGATGYAMTLDAMWGVKWIEELHEALAYAMLALVALHVAGVAIASLRHGENLVRAMITGRKRAD